MSGRHQGERWTRTLTFSSEHSVVNHRLLDKRALF
jgi:hypothetical protein